MRGGNVARRNYRGRRLDFARVPGMAEMGTGAEATDTIASIGGASSGRYTIHRPPVRMGIFAATPPGGIHTSTERTKCALPARGPARETPHIGIRPCGIPACANGTAHYGRTDAP